MEPIIDLKNAIILIKQFEGCLLTAYEDAKGINTIGYGHTSQVTEGMKIDQATAEQFLSDDLLNTLKHIAFSVRSYLNNNQLCACLSLAFNIGTGNFSSSTLVQKIKNKDFIGAADEFLRWDKVNGKSCFGLSRRREAERALFLSPQT